MKVGSIAYHNNKGMPYFIFYKVSSLLSTILRSEYGFVKDIATQDQKRPK
jgi:hypothetical protein